MNRCDECRHFQSYKCSTYYNAIACSEFKPHSQFEVKDE